LEPYIKRKVLLTRLDYVAALIGCLIFLVFWLVIATFPNFFFINPQNQLDPLRRAELIFSSIGWILISTFAPICLLIYSRGRHGAIKFLPVTALVWPISLVTAQITSYVQTGYFYLEYLTQFPIFVFTDIALPILILIIWVDLREHHSKQMESANDTIGQI
jgi:hypothetical protein